MTTPPGYTPSTTMPTSIGASTAAPTAPAQPQAGLPNPTPGQAPYTVGSTAWLQNQQLTYEDQMRQATQQKGLDHADLASAVLTPLEWVGSKAYWLYSNLISHPLSTALIAGQHADVGNGSLFSGATWAKSWNEAKSVSPGQAFYIDANGFFDDAWEKQQLIGTNKDGTLIWDHPNQVQQYFHSGGSAQWVSGGMDAALSWEVDPLSLAGKGLKLANAAAYTKAVTTTANETFKGAIVGKGLQLAGKVAGVSPEGLQDMNAAWQSRLVTSNVDKAIGNSTFNKFSNYIMDNKQRLGDSFANWAVNQKWAQTSASAGAVAHYLSQAEDQHEVNAILAGAMGDGNTAINSLIGKNNQIAAMMQTMWKQRDDWFQDIQGVNPHRFDPSDPVHQQYAQQLSAYTDQMNAIEAQTRRLSQATEISNTLKNGLYFNSVVSPMAAKVGQAASAAYHYGDNASLIYNNTMLRPVRLLQRAGNAWSAIRPKGWIKLDDPNSYKELDAQLRDSKMYTPAERAEKVSQYINAPYKLKRRMLYGVEGDVLGRMADKYGMTPEGAKVLYDTFQDARGKAFSPQYSEATIDLNGTKVNVANVEHDGGLTAVHPLLQTQLENEHPFMDLNKMNSILKLNASSFQRLIDEGKEYREAAQQAASLTGNPTVLGKTSFAMQKSKDAYNALTDTFNHLWKFNAHFRLGYGPRQLADEWLSQAARLGAYNLLSNAVSGMKGQFLRGGDRMAPSWMWDATGYSQKVIDADTKLQAAKDLHASLTANRTSVAAYTLRSEKAIGKRNQMLGHYDDQLSQLQGNIDGLERTKQALIDGRQKLVNKRIVLPNGQMVNAFGEGPEGRLAVDLNSGRQSIDSTLGGSTAAYVNGLRGDLARKTYHWNDGQHLQAWLKNVQYQIAHDPAAMQVVKGMNADQLAMWMKNTPEGRAYHTAVGIGNWTKDEHADRIVAHVNHVLPQANAEMDAVRQAVGRGADDAEVANLMRQTPEGLRPMINEKDFGIATGKTMGMQMIDRFISGWYRRLGETPVNVLSRNPLASTLYRNHVKEIFANYEKMGRTSLTNSELDQVAEQARKMAIRDVKKYTYNMDFETKVSHMVRGISPFFGAGAEAINRWARVLTEKPESLGKMAYLYDTPMKAGMEYTYDGRPVTDGYAYNPQTGKNELVPTSETMIRFQLPGWMASTLGVPQDERAEIPLSSLVLPFRNNPWFNPGEGPLVQIAANQFALSSTQHPEIGDWMQRLGILPTGVTNASAVQQMLGSTFHSIQTSQSDGTLQAMALQAMQEESYRYANGLRSTQPTWTEVMSRAQHMADLKGWFKGSTLLPFSVDFQDPYQFFRDQYKQMEAANPQTADQNFYAKYGASAYAFSASLSKNNIPGIAATGNAQRAASYFKDLISRYPDMAGLIIGNVGGSYSQTAYQQQVASGQRTQTSAQDAWNTVQANLGWAIYNNYMNGLNNQLFQRGLTTYNDKGAADLLQQKIALVKMLGSPTMPDGVTPNAYYNQQWTEAYNAYDPSKQNRQALEMANIVQSKELQGRQDIQGLAQYLALRGSVQEAMAERANAKPAKSLSGALQQMYGDINTKANADLKTAFQQGVMNLIQENTAFQDLHDRYLNSDLGFDHYAGTSMANTYTGRQ